MSPYLPNLHNLAGIGGLAATLAMLVVLGSAVLPKDEYPETKLLVGWGGFCLVLTFWGVMTPLDLRLPLVALAAIALVIVLVPRWRARIGRLDGIGRMLILTLPLWLVMLPLRPSQIDTWLNLLPNAAYLFDFGMFPTSLRPPSYSFLPVAPYNTQFVAFSASVAVHGFADGVMGLFNIALQCAAALLIARVIVRGDVIHPAGIPPWWACAAGFLIAVPLNPGFVPRVFFSSYGESALAVTVVFAVWLASRVLAGLARQEDWRGSATALALLLAAMVNIKQSGIGLTLPVGATMLTLGLLHPQIKTRQALVVTATVLVPGLVLYAIWRPFATASFPAGELKMLPVEQWNWVLLPGILRGMLHAMYQKATYFIFEGAVLILAIRQLRRLPWSGQGLLLGMAAGVIVLFTGFLIFTYIAHFPPSWALRAHSFFRYSSQLSLAVMLALAVALRPIALRWLDRLGAVAQRRLRFGLVAVTVALPFLAIGLLRFDLDAPQPELWDLGVSAAQYIEPNSRLALVLPGEEDDTVGSMLRGVLLFAPPRRAGLDFTIETSVTPDILDTLANEGIPLALISCVPAGLADAPAGGAALLKRTEDGWRTVHAWAYPPDLAKRHFSAMLARGPVCQGPRLAGRDDSLAAPE